MLRRKPKIFRVDLPVKRAFSWRAFLILVMLYFLGNLAGIPLLRKTNMPIEPPWFWGLATLISAIVIALSLLMANRTGLGGPLLEGRLSKKDLPGWLRSGLALSILVCVAGAPLSWIANRGAALASYPFGWELLAASFKAGAVEEILYRLFLVSLFARVGSLFKRDEQGRPVVAVYWISIWLAGLLFGWAHVDARLGHPEATFGDYTLIMVLSSALGIYFGWLFWKLGIEWAVLAHFAYDAFVSMILIPIHVLKNPLAWAVLIAGMALAAILAWRCLLQGVVFSAKES